VKGKRTCGKRQSLISSKAPGVKGKRVSTRELWKENNALVINDESSTIKRKGKESV